MRVEIAEKVLERLATSDKTTIVNERLVDGKMRVTFGGRAEVARCPQELGNLDPVLSSSISYAAL
jgi:hypothetical protein